MSVKRKSPALAAASRANGRKSKGPVTGRGKAISRLNAAKHWGRAEVMRDGWRSARTVWSASSTANSNF